CRQLHQRDSVLRQPLAKALQRRAAFDSGFARRDAHLEELARGKKRLRAGRVRKVAPLEPRLDHEHLALAVTLGPNCRADAVGGLDRVQRLVADYGVERLYAAPVAGL